MLGEVWIAEDGEARREGLTREVGLLGLREVGIEGAGLGEEEGGADGCPAKVLGVLEDLRADSTTIDCACTSIILLEDVGALLDEEEGSFPHIAKGSIPHIVIERIPDRSHPKAIRRVNVDIRMSKHQLDAIAITTPSSGLKHIPPIASNHR
jgi:hypothetical protein